MLDGHELNKEILMLQEGDVIELNDGMKVYAMVPEHFVYSNRRGSLKLTHHDVKIGGELDYLAGKYVVTKTIMDGGGTGRGPHDVYPNGHHVFCVNIDDENTKIDFYQSGFFTAIIENIEPIGKAKLKWSI